MPYFVYILESQRDGRFYIGQNSDLNERLHRHNSGMENYTKSRGPWALFWNKKVATRAEAMKLERKLKNMKSCKRILEFAGPVPPMRDEDARP